MRYVVTLLVLASLPLIHGCAAIAVGGAAAAGGYMVGEDRRPVGVMTDDQAIEFKISNRVAEKYPNAHVNATSFDRLVLLTGEVPTDAAKPEVEKIARSVENVRNVVNELQVAGASSFPARANDSYITSKVKTRFLDARKFNAVHVKVVTEAGTVYLMGIVTRQEANDATEIARTTGGVQRVVRVFEYRD
jgi:osmotically-inducible protein OsmY